MFSSIGLFKKTQCPEYPHCSLNYCLFAHEHTKSSNGKNSPKRSSSPLILEVENNHDRAEGPHKRRRLNSSQSMVNGDRHHPAIDVSPNPIVSKSQTLVAPLKTPEASLPRTASRSISPPPRRIAKDASAKRSTTENKKPFNGPGVPNGLDPGRTLIAAAKLPTSKIQASAESLNPRLLPNPPGSHAARVKLVTLLHEQLVRLNNEVKNSQDASKENLILTDQQLIVEALDEEFRLATKNPTVYQTVIKTRIMVLRKTRLDVWMNERKRKVAQTQQSATLRKATATKIIDTGLTHLDEVAFLPRLAANQEGLAKHGYVTVMPTVAELDAAQKGVESAQGWELCDRCKTRFQVFPGRRTEDGALTSGGSCIYHWAKPRRPDMAKGDTKPRDLKYACCDEIVGVSAGCTKADAHVFKISDPKRLALVMPFESTPASDRTDLPGAVCFDCEMGYSTCGMELIRLTATAWPDGSELLDVLVRPIGEVLDLNSRFSGVWPEDWANANRFDEPGAPSRTDFKPVLKIVESPARARELLFELITPQTPLIGHALENDLNATRILHPVIIDTCLLYPHPRGLPIRFGLKVLMKKHLDRDIQMGGADGHDSKEDARAAGDLVRFRIRNMWQKMKGEGWTTREVEFYPPLPPG